MTTLNLKNARRLEKAIEQHLSTAGNEHKTSLTVSAYQEFKTIIEGAGRTAFDEVLELEEYVNIRYRIRSLIAAANASCGINALMVEEAGIRAKLNLFNRFANGDVLTDERRDAIITRLEKWDGTTSLGDSYSSRNSDEIKINSVLSEEARDEAAVMVRAWKKRITAIADECSSLNIQTTVTVSKDDTDALAPLDLL